MMPESLEYFGKVFNFIHLFITKTAHMSHSVFSAFCGLLLLLANSFAQAQDAPLAMAEEQPEPIGGFTALYTHIQKNQRYPEEAAQAKVRGKVYVRFVVQKDGSLAQLQVQQGIGYGCDEEALRLLRTGPRWKAGKQNKKPVDVWMTLPITFKP